jgi:hypothetical protein
MLVVTATDPTDQPRVHRVSPRVIVPETFVALQRNFSTVSLSQPRAFNLHLLTGKLHYSALSPPAFDLLVVPLTLSRQRLFLCLYLRLHHRPSRRGRKGMQLQSQSQFLYRSIQIETRLLRIPQYRCLWAFLFSIVLTDMATASFCG